jgi:ferrous iron transport protein B
MYNLRAYKRLMASKLNENTVLEKIPLITLLGHPNSGKTTLFNLLSGKKYKTVNYPGSTVEYSISHILGKYSVNAKILDSPGIISLIPCSPDEKLSVDYIFSHPKFGPTDIAVVTIDSSQLSRQLLLVKQLVESKFRVIVALTMNDLLNKKGYDINTVKLSEILSCDVVKIDGRTGEGVDNLLMVIKKDMEAFDEAIERQLPLESTHEELLLSFKKISSIEDSVLKPINVTEADKDSPDLSEANKQLKVLSGRSGAHRKPDSFTLKLDKFLLHKFWGVVVFLLIMSITFTAIFWLAAPVMDLIDLFFGTLSGFAFDRIGDNWLGDLIANGIIAGIGSVLIFLPQIVILFLILGLLEDSGYLARGAMLIDKPLSKIGLNGRSFVPMLSGFACAIPAIMATRTIQSKRERFLTIFIIPLMSCSARLPVYALLLAYLTPGDKPWIGGLSLAGIYVFSIISSLIIAGIVSKFSKKLVPETDNSSFIIELPAYRTPNLREVIMRMFKSSGQYVSKAGPIIIYLSLILWFLTSFPNYNPDIPRQENMEPEQYEEMISYERLSHSYASTIGKVIDPVMQPLGMDWRVGVSMVATFAAREVFVSSMALIFKITDDDEDALQESMLGAMREATNESTGKKLFTPSTIVGLIVFFVFAMQCLSTVAIAKKETGGWKIPILQVVIFTGIAYIMALIAVNGLQLLGVQ